MKICETKQLYKPEIRELTLQRGISYPTDEELVMMILGSGNRNIPVQKMAELAVNVLNNSTQENLVQNLLKIKGMGKSKALAIASSIELGRRRNCHKAAKVRHPRDVLPFVRNYSVQNREYFLCITLNGNHEIISIRVCSIGTVNETIVHPREVYSEALKENAAAIVVCHNHPSGNCEPSQADIETTGKLVNCSNLLGITLLDHIIFSQNSHFSFLENHLLFTQD